MQDFIIWLDSEKAHVFELNSESKDSKITKENFEHHMPHKKGTHEHPANEVLFKELAARVSSASKLLVMGPGLAKNQFRTFLNENHTHTLAKHLVGVETCDHPTDKQILAIAGKFFVHYDLFNEPVLASRSRE